MTKVMGGPAQPVKVVTGRRVGGPARRVYGYAAAPTDGRKALGGPAQPVVVITDADLKENGGPYVLDGQTYAMPVFTAPAGAKVVGGPAIPVYPVNAWPVTNSLPLLPTSFAPTLGNELITNPGLEGVYAGGLAPNWTNSGGTKSAETTIKHGGSESQKLVTGGANQGLYQAIVSPPAAGTWIQSAVWMYVTSGTATMLPIWNNFQFPAPTASSSAAAWTRKIVTFRTVSPTNIGPWLSANHPTTCYFDDVSYKPIVLSSALKLLDAGRPDTHVSVKVTCTPGTQAGIAARVDSATSPANFLLVYTDGTNIYLDRIIAGSYSNLITAAITYADGKTLSLDVYDTIAVIKYDNVVMGQAAVLASNATLFGEFSTYEDNRFSDFAYGDLWVDDANNPILGPDSPDVLTAWSSVLKVGSTYHLYYTYNQNDDVIGHATSSDGKTWTKDAANNPVLGQGAAGKFDDTKVWLPVVWKEGATWRMLYTGINAGGVQATGYATSSDGLSWTKQNSGNAVLTGTVAAWDANDAEANAVIKIGTTYYLWYDTNNAPANRQVGLATSDDLLTWTKHASNPIFNNTGGGRYCVGVFKVDTNYYLVVPHFTGVTRTVFELYRDDDPQFLSAHRTFLGLIKSSYGTGNWKTLALDTPCILTDDIARNTFTASNGELWMYYAGKTNETVDIWRVGLAVANPTIALSGI